MSNHNGYLLDHSGTKDSIRKDKEELLTNC